MRPFDKTLFFTLSILVPGLVLLGETAMADNVQGTVELYQNWSVNKTTDETGVTTEGRTNSSFDRYWLSFNDKFYPFLDLRAGLRVEKATIDTDTFGGQELKMDATTLMPSLGLTLQNPFVKAGVNYDKREQTQGMEGFPDVTKIREAESAFLGFKPDGLPTLDFLFGKMETYDKHRVSFDTIARNFTLSSSYAPVKNLDLNYTAMWSNNENLMTSSEYDNEMQTGRISYGRTFMQDRVSFGTSYNIVQNEATVSTSKGLVLFSVYPVAGLAGINNIPQTGTLPQNAALINNNMTDNTGVNIGQNPTMAGDTNQRNIGLDLGTAKAVNKLYVWVDRSLPESVVKSFKWQIYTSSDGLNWKPWGAPIVASFGQFDFRFELDLVSVIARYIKVVTRPLEYPLGFTLPLGTDVSNIYITEMQAFNSADKGKAVGKYSQTMEANDASVRVKLLATDKRTVYYDLYFQDLRTKMESPATYQYASSYVVNNAVNATERFSKVLSGYARIGLQNSSDAGGVRNNLALYDLSLTAAGNSLPRLSHSAVLSLTRRQSDGIASDAASLMFSSNAEIYPGITATLNGGENLSYSQGVRGENSAINFGLGIVPNRDLRFSVQYDLSSSKQSGGTSIPRQYTKSLQESASYNPFSTLYLYATITTVETSIQPRSTIGNYSLSWTARQGRGSLQFNFAYAESIDSTRTKVRTISPGARWKINPRMLLDAWYTVTETETPTVRTENKGVGSSFKLYY